jgi:ElaB/YqjD/DUF883 family membrane-anchored ribosome-binding protein
MTNETIAIREEIDRTRMEMAHTLEQLETRLDPQLLKEHAKTAAYDATVGKAKTMVSRTSNGIVDTIKANPVPLALTALGIGWLVVNARAPQAKQRVANVIGDRTDDIRHQARDFAHKAQARGQELESTAARTFDDNPLAIGLGVAAVGLLIGLAIPTSQKENELLGATRDRLAHRAIGKVDQLAHQAIDKTKDQLGTNDQPHT